MILKRRLFLSSLVASALLGSLFVLTGCQSSGASFVRAVILNSTPETLSNVSVEHMPTRKSASVSFILPGRTLEIGFSPKEMLAESAAVTWSDPSGLRREEILDLPSPPKDTSFKYILVYEIQSNGHVHVYFEKERELTVRQP